jgi:thiamine pyrophosphate-dependent acetolactate synthase large subunit-like protein
VKDTPLCAIVHSNVGLMHATMAVFNAWCDRAPLLLLGATGPVDAAKRRPWIDWIHTAKDQGALIRDYTKWDDQPASVPAALESLLRAWQITQTAPRGPVYVCLDAALQEMRLEHAPKMPDVSRFAAPPPADPPRALLAEAAARLAKARRPLLLMGRMSRSEDHWAARIALAEKLGALVLTDMKIAGAFPTTHARHAAAPSTFPSEAACTLLREADVIVAFDWVDLDSALRIKGKKLAAKAVHVSMDQHLHNGAHANYLALPELDIFMAASPDAVIADLVEDLGPGATPCWQPLPRRRGSGCRVAPSLATSGAHGRRYTGTSRPCAPRACRLRPPARAMCSTRPPTRSFLRR